MDQLGRRDAEGVFRIPGTAVRLAKSRAQRQDHVGIAAGIIDVLVPQKPVMPSVKG